MKSAGKKSKKTDRIIRTSLRGAKTRLVLGTLLFCAGVLLFMGMTPVADQSRFLTECRTLLNGLAGNTLHWILPALLVLAGAKLAVSLHHAVSWRAYGLAGAFYLALLGFLTLITNLPGFGSLMSYIGEYANRGAGMKAPMSYEAYLSFAYRYGAVDLQAQGALGMAVAYPVWRFLGNIVGAVLLGVLLAALLFSLFRIKAGEIAANAADSLSEMRYRRSQGRNARREEVREEPVLEGIYPDEEGMNVPPAGEMPVQPAPPRAASRYQPAAEQTPPYRPFPEMREAADPEDSGEETRYYPVSVDQVYDEYVQEKAGKPARPAGRRRTAAPAAKDTPTDPAPAPEALSGEQDVPQVPVQGIPKAPVKPAPESALPGGWDRTRTAAEAEGPEEEPLPWEEPAAARGRSPSVPAAQEKPRPAAQEKPRPAAQERPAVRTAAERPGAAPVRADSVSRSTAVLSGPSALPGEGSARSLPADSQKTAQVQYNGAVPVTTDNVMEHSIERQSIGGNRRRADSAPDTLDGMARDRNASMEIDTRSDVVYHYPPIELLNPGIDFNRQDHSQEDRQKAQQIESTLDSFNIQAKVMQIMHGPAITRFAIQIAPGIRVQRVTGMADNLALSLATKHVRVEAPIQGTNYIGIEVPNKLISTVSLREVLDSAQMKQNRSPLAVSLGKDIAGTPVVCDLSKMPHLLIAGATGSGKSVCIHSIVCSLLYRSSPQEVRLIMIDPKQVELSVYNDVPHLLIPVVTDVRKAAGALGWAVKEMTERYSRFSSEGVRNLEGYNRNHPDDGGKLPNIVIIIDEMADLMDVCRKDVEEYIRRLAALARAAGIYMVLATQRPSVDVITGVIKNNIPSRIAFAVSSGTDSRTILDTFGAEKLMGKGDMLYKPAGVSASRVQGSFVSDDEVAAFTDYIKEHSSPEYDSAILDHLSTSGQKDNGADYLDGAAGMDDDTVDADGSDQLLHEAIQMAIEDGQTSTSMLQRRLRIGYARAGRLVDEMEKRGVVSSQEGSKPRKTLITREQYYEMFSDDPSQEG